MIEHEGINQDDIDLQLKQLIDDEIESAIRPKFQSIGLIENREKHGMCSLPQEIASLT